MVASTAAESGCEWVAKGSLALPDFPEFSGFVPKLPALPNLLPWGVQKWNELGTQQELSAAPATTDESGGTTAAFGVGALSGLLVGVLFAFGLGSARSRRKGVRQGVRTTAAHAKGTALQPSHAESL